MTPQAARELIAQGPEIVLVKHLARAGYSSERFEMLLVTAQEARILASPLVDFGSRQAGWRWRCHQWFIAGQTFAGRDVAAGAEHVTVAVYDYDRHQNDAGVRTAGRGGP